jgi:hypothetical protein
MVHVIVANTSQPIRQELVKECLQKGTELVQAIADSLFTLPSTEDVDGPLVKLPPPTTKLPREKHVLTLLSLFNFIIINQPNCLLIKFCNLVRCQGQDLLLNGKNLPKRKVSCAVYFNAIYVFCFDLGLSSTCFLIFALAEPCSVLLCRHY